MSQTDEITLNVSTELDIPEKNMDNIQKKNLVKKIQELVAYVEFFIKQRDENKLVMQNVHAEYQREIQEKDDKIEKLIIKSGSASNNNSKPSSGSRKRSLD